uniref:Major facilitator superfamily domain containing 10 n=1 Tax=Nothoprocta perdicaria TaxID=30464 RepID=A0A8C7E8U9_NOTPE
CIWAGSVGVTTRTAQRQEQSSNRVITIVFLALLIDLLGFALILPLFPSILDYYSKTEDGFYSSLQHSVDWFAVKVGMPPERKYNSVLFGGLIGSIFSILQFFSSPLTGAVSDCLGRRPVILMTMGLIASYALWAASRTFGIFLLSRIIGGISKGNVSLSTAIIADLHSPKARSKGMVTSSDYQCQCLVPLCCFLPFGIWGVIPCDLCALRCLQWAARHPRLLLTVSEGTGSSFPGVWMTGQRQIFWLPFQNSAELSWSR